MASKTTTIEIRYTDKSENVTILITSTRALAAGKAIIRELADMGLPKDLRISEWNDATNVFEDCTADAILAVAFEEIARM